MIFDVLQYAWYTRDEFCWWYILFIIIYLLRPVHESHFDWPLHRDIDWFIFAWLTNAVSFLHVCSLTFFVTHNCYYLFVFTLTPISIFVAVTTFCSYPFFSFESLLTSFSKPLTEFLHIRIIFFRRIIFSKLTFGFGKNRIIPNGVFF